MKTPKNFLFSDDEKDETFEIIGKTINMIVTSDNYKRFVDRTKKRLNQDKFQFEKQIRDFQKYMKTRRFKKEAVFLNGRDLR